MKQLLENTISVLTSSTSLTALIDAKNISVGNRQPTKFPAIELRISGSQRGPKGHSELVMTIDIHSKSETGSSSEVWGIDEELTNLLTARNLTPSDYEIRGFRVAQCRLIDTSEQPFTDYSATIRKVYRLKVNDSNSPRQSQ